MGALNISLSLLFMDAAAVVAAAANGYGSLPGGACNTYGACGA